jgi:hypothetical protein
MRFMERYSLVAPAARAQQTAKPPRAADQQHKLASSHTGSQVQTTALHSLKRALQ